MKDCSTIIYRNGRIFTADPSNPEAQAMLVQDGRIAWVGSEAALPPVPGHAQTVDLGGRRVIPGFVDAHMHPLMLADFRKQITIMPPAIRSIADLVEAIRAQRAAQQPGQWIEGWGYDEGELAERRSPTRWDLDAGCADAPVCVVRTCAHIRCVNSAALAMAGITRDTPDPPGGEIERDANGEPTGVLKENARFLVQPFLPTVAPAQRLQNLLELGDVLSSHGVTAVCDMATMDKLDTYAFYSQAAAHGFAQHVGIYHLYDSYVGDAAFDIPAAQLDRSRQVFVAGLKLIGDGSVSGRTAWMDQPYLGPGEEYGISTCTAELYSKALAFCKAHSCQLAVHAMGRRTISQMVQRAVAAGQWMPQGIPSVRLEHVTDPSPESIAQMAAAGIAVVTQPVFLYAESASYLKNIGQAWMQRCYPVRSMLAAGVQVGFSTDAPATFWADGSDPRTGLKLAVTRRSYSGVDCGSAEAIDIATAVALYTREAARAAGFSRLGMLAAGYQADFVVLDRDLLALPGEEIDQVQVCETWIGGVQVYCRR